MNSKNNRRISAEEKIVSDMIFMYCRGNHKHKKEKPCDDCVRLIDYTAQRLKNCPFKNKKPFCSNCTIRCYNNEERSKIKKVMKYSAPRMVLTHPLMIISHLGETLFERLKMKLKP